MRDVLKATEDRDGRVVHPDVDPAEAIGGSVHERADRHLVGHVGGHGERPPPELGLQLP